MKKILCSLLLAIFSVCWAYAQTTVSGVVKDPTGETLPGASVFIKGTTKGTLTDANGKFTLKVTNPGTDIIKVSFIGMGEKEVALKGKTTGIVIHLTSNTKQLDEMVVVGYGTMKRKDVTGAVASLNPEVIKDLPVSSPMEALTGRLAGVNVQTTEGSPDATINIRVRGGGSITQTNAPLYIVDGFKVPTIANIAPRDIESIDVLKDASSTAIYGSEGANGVIIITTKGGKKGKITVNFNSFYGSKKAYNLPRALDPYEYVYYQRELDQGSGFTSMYGPWSDVSIYKSNKGQDWVRKIFNNPTAQQNYNLSVTGGSEALNFNLSLTHDDQGFIMDNSHFTRDNVNFKINAKISNSIQLDFTNRLAYTNISGPSVSGGLLKDCVLFPSVNSLTQLSLELVNGQDDVSLESIGSLNNPIANINNYYKKQYQLENTYNTGLTWKIVKGLSYRGQVSYTFKRNNTDEIWTKNTGKSNENGGFPLAQRNDIKGDRYNYQNVLTFNHQFNKANRMDLVVGQEANHTQDNQMIAQSKFYPANMTSDQILAMWNYGTAQPTYTTVYEPERTFSFFGRLNYNLMDRYSLTLTVRRDGKNVFSPECRWGNFPGAAVAWRISEEPFMKQNEFVSSIISNMKMRVGYGEVGNARVPSYWRQDWSFESSLSKLAYFGESNTASAMKTKTTMYNDKLKWESNVNRNLGFDFGLFKDRINGSVDIYRSTMKNLILQMPLPASSGYSNQYQNAGQTSNRGVEISLNGYLINTKDFRLDANFNIAFNKNMIDKYVVERQTVSSGSPYYTSGNDYVVEEGKPLGQMLGYVVDGVYTFDDFFWSSSAKKWVLYSGKVSDQSLLATSGNYFGPGHLKLKDINGDGVITEVGDKVVVGNAQPKHVGGFGLNARWKGLDCSTLFNWSYGNDIYNVNKIIFNTYSGSKKYNNVMPAFALGNRFTTIDPESGNNIMFGTYADPDKLKELNQNSSIWNPNINSTVPISWAVEDGSFLRMSSLTLGYTLPEHLSRKLFISNFRIYTTVYNVFCLTKYSGQDPEVSTGSGNLTMGRDYSAYPKARNFVMGVNLTF